MFNITMHLVKKIDDFLEKIERYLVVLLFFLLVFFISLNIISRNIIDHSFEEIYEYTPALVLWFALAGSSLALKKRRHIKLEFMLKFYPDKYRYYANFLVSVFGMGVMGILFYSSIGFFENEVHIFGRKGFFSVIFPLFFIISFFRYFTWMLYDIPKKNSVK